MTLKTKIYSRKLSEKTYIEFFVKEEETTQVVLMYTQHKHGYIHLHHTIYLYIHFIFIFVKTVLAHVGDLLAQSRRRANLVGKILRELRAKVREDRLAHAGQNGAHNGDGGACRRKHARGVVATVSEDDTFRMAHNKAANFAF